MNTTTSTTTAVIARVSTISLMEAETNRVES
jgi:hypothetical protein